MKRAFDHQITTKDVITTVDRKDSGESPLNLIKIHRMFGGGIPKYQWIPADANFLDCSYWSYYGERSLGALQKWNPNRFCNFKRGYYVNILRGIYLLHDPPPHSARICSGRRTHLPADHLVFSPPDIGC